VEPCQGRVLAVNRRPRLPLDEEGFRGRYPGEVNEYLFDLVGGNFGHQVRETEFPGWEHP